MKYTGTYIYPPRPSEKITKTRLFDFDNDLYLAQPKYNGDAVVVFLKGGMVTVYNRHKELYTKCKIDLTGLFNFVPDRSQDYVFCGEYLSKNKLGEDGTPFNHALIIWDILVWQDNWLVNSTFQERADLIEAIFPARRMEINIAGKLEGMTHCIMTDDPHIFRAPVYTYGFRELYEDIVKTDLYEGLVLKRKDAKLKPGWTSENNTDWQIKVRKETNNYHF